MILHLKGAPILAHSKQKPSRMPRPSLSRSESISQVAQKGISTHSADPRPFFVPKANLDDGIARNDYELAMKAKRVGDIAKEARILQHVVDQYLGTSVIQTATMDLADLDFRLGYDKSAYNLLSAYNARYRIRPGEVCVLEHRDFLLLTSLAVAKQGQVFAGQRKFLLSVIEPYSNQYTADLTKTSSVRDITLLSYLALASYWDEYKGTGEGSNYRGGGLWYYQQAYKLGGPTAYLDYKLAHEYYFEPKVAIKYLDDARTRDRKTGDLHDDIEGYWTQLYQLIKFGRKYSPGPGQK